MKKKQFLKWMGIVALVFILILIGIVFAKSKNKKQGNNEEAIIKDNVCVITDETEKKDNR